MRRDIFTAAYGIYNSMMRQNDVILMAVGGDETAAALLQISLYKQNINFFVFYNWP
jgi:hypothetical protein